MQSSLKRIELFSSKFLPITIMNAENYFLPSKFESDFASHARDNNLVMCTTLFQKLKSNILEPRLI